MIFLIDYNVKQINLLMANEIPSLPTTRLNNVRKFAIIEHHPGITSPWPTQERCATAKHTAILENKSVFIKRVVSSLCCDKTCKTCL